jgi:hypothetical protein
LLLWQLVFPIPFQITLYTSQLFIPSLAFHEHCLLLQIWEGPGQNCLSLGLTRWSYNINFCKDNWFYRMWNGNMAATWNLYLAFFFNGDELVICNLVWR